MDQISLINHDHPFPSIRIMGIFNSKPALRPHHQELRDILTPQLFHRLHSLYLPFSKAEPLNALSVADWFLGTDPSLGTDFYTLCMHDVLLPLSLHPLDSLPDLTTFLPHPTSRDYPIQAFGLQILLDQVPRYCLSGIDKRWISGYFDVLSVKVIDQLYNNVPYESRWDNPTRWQILGYPAEQILLRRILMVAPYVHSANWGDHLMHFGLVEQIRREAETMYRTADALREVQTRDAKDKFEFGRILKRYEDVRKGIKRLDDFIFLFARVMRLHEPVIREFGRSPEKCMYLGLDVTDGEKEYLDESGFRADEEVLKKIRQDKANGIWTPLQGKDEKNAYLSKDM